MAQHFIDKYGLSWPNKQALSDFANGENVVKLSEIKKGECFSAPFNSCVSFKLSDHNFYFNYSGSEHPHTIEHEDPHVLVTKRPDMRWDFDKNEIIRESN